MGKRVGKAQVKQPIHTVQCFFYQGEGEGGGQTRVLEMLRRGGINHQAVQQNKVKIQGGGGGGTCDPREANVPLCHPLNEILHRTTSLEASLFTKMARPKSQLFNKNYTFFSSYIMLSIQEISNTEKNKGLSAENFKT